MVPKRKKNGFLGVLFATFPLCTGGEIGVNAFVFEGGFLNEVFVSFRLLDHNLCYRYYRLFAIVLGFLED